MRAIILAATAILALAGSASAQMINAPGKFCLRTTSGANQGMETCAYQTMAQCDAAKAGQSDQCVPNASIKGADNMKGAAKPTTTGSGSKQ